MYKFQEKQAKDIFVDLYDSTTGLPYPGVPASGLVLKYAKAGESTYTTKVLTEGVDGNFAEIGDGVYKISFLADELDTLGQFVFVIAGTGIYTILEQRVIIAEVEPAQYIAAVIPPTCLVFGNVKELTGIPSDTPVVVKAQVVELPAQQQGNYISTHPVTAYTDADGLFKLRLAIGTLVVLEIADVGFRRQFTVPELTSVDIKDI